MNIATNKTSPKQVTSCYKSDCLAALALMKADTQEEEYVGYATIDGHMVPHLEVATAVNSGSGIFIGDYFVGFADHQSAGLAHFIRY